MAMTVTTDLAEFLEKEYPNFERIFKDKDRYIAHMSDVVKACGICGTLYWRDCKKKCDCHYHEALKQLNKTLL